MTNKHKRQMCDNNPRKSAGFEHSDMLQLSEYKKVARQTIRCNGMRRIRYRAIFSRSSAVQNWPFCFGWDLIPCVLVRLVVFITCTMIRVFCKRNLFIKLEQSYDEMVLVCLILISRLLLLFSAGRCRLAVVVVVAVVVVSVSFHELFQCVTWDVIISWYMARAFWAFVIARLCEPCKYI